MATNDTLRIRIRSDGTGRVKADMQGVGRSVDQVSDRGERLDRVGGKIEETLKGAAIAAGGLVAAFGTRELLRNIAEYERLNAVLKVFEGSAAAASERFAELQRFASQTPFQLQEIVEGFTRLKARGLDPSIETMKDLGNIAAASGRTMEQAIEAAADAATGEGERLKEFGIQMRTEGDRVRIIFGNTTREVEKNAASIVGALRDISQENFAGSIEEQMDTLNGRLSNFQDALFQLSAAIGEGGLGQAAKDSLGIMTELVTTVRLLLELKNEMDGGGGGGGVGGLAGELFSPETANPFSPGGMKNIGRTSLQLLTEAERRLNEFMQARVTASQEARRAEKAWAEETERAAEQAFGALSEGARNAANEIEFLKGHQDSLSNQLDVISGGGLVGESALGGSRPEFELMPSLLGDVSGAQRELTDAQKKAEEQAKKYLDKLREQTEEFGKSEAELIRLRGEQMAQKAATEATAEAIRNTANALADMITGEERAALAAEHEADVREHLNQSIEDEAEARDKARAATARHNQAIQSIIEKYDPVIRGARQFNEEVALLNEAFDKGMFGEGPEALDELQEKLKAAAENAQDVMLGGDPDEGVDSWVTAWERGIERLDDLFADLWKDFFKEGSISMDRLEDFAGNLMGEVMQSLMRPLTDQLSDFVQGQLGDVGRGENGQLSGKQQAGMIGGTLAGSMLGGGGRGASAGSGIGSAIGLAISGGNPIAAAIGGALGGLVGGLFDDDEPDDPRLQVGGSGQIQQGTAFGSVGASSVGGPGLGPDKIRKIVAQLTEMDNALAMLLGRIDPGLIQDAAAAVEDWNLAMEGDDIDAAAAALDRFRTVINATVPEFAGFLNSIEDPQKALESLNAILDIQDQMEDLGRTMESIGAGPVEQVTLTLDKLEDQLTDTRDALASAIATGDPQRVAEAADNARQAVQEWLNAQIDLARELSQELISVRRGRRQFDRQIAQRLAGVTDRNPDIAVLERQIPGLQGLATFGGSPEERMANLQELLGAVDQWLQASRDRINNMLAEQLQALDSERDAILAKGRERAQRAAEAAQRASQAAQQARQREIEALQKQLGLAQEWKRLSEELAERIEGLRLSTASPLTGFQRLEEINRLIQQAESQRAGATGEERIEASRRLEELLTRRLNLVDQESLFQAPTAERTDIFNETVRKLETLRAEAAGEAEGVDPIEEQLKRLQQSNASGFAGVSQTNVQLTRQEQERLDEIEAERQAAQEDAQAALDAIDREAAGYYRWARGHGRDLQNQIEERVAAQLEELTGGLPVDEFIARQQERATGFLENIDRQLRDFLDFLRGAVAGNGAGGPGIPGDPPVSPGVPSRPSIVGNGEIEDSPGPTVTGTPVGTGTKGGALIGNITIHAEGSNDPDATAANAERGVLRAVDEVRRQFPHLLREHGPVVGDVSKVS